MENTFGVPVLEAYGMTEAAHQVASNPLVDGKRVPGSVGIGTGVKIAIMDQDGNIEPANVTGEVVIQGENVTQGYENNPEANLSSFTNGWFRTGDQGVMDSDGYLKLVGRLKEIIIRSGENISPREIDETLLAHPAVSEAVAFAVPSATHGEEPSAAVVVTGAVKASELVVFCRERLAGFKCPKIIHIVDEIPRTATGKVQRRIVSAAFA
jgi:acyl-CoA synthetase (AMP-forming)/AMP-acid ligase II